jgi:hydrogenase maturation factor
MKDERKSSLIVLQADMTIEEIEVIIEEIQRVSEYMGIKLTFKQQEQ